MVVVAGRRIEGRLGPHRRHGLRSVRIRIESRIGRIGSIRDRFVGVYKARRVATTRWLSIVVRLRGLASVNALRLRVWTLVWIQGLR